MNFALSHRPHFLQCDSTSRAVCRRSPSVTGQYSASGTFSFPRKAASVGFTNRRQHASEPTGSASLWSAKRNDDANKSNATTAGYSSSVTITRSSTEKPFAWMVATKPRPPRAGQNLPSPLLCDTARSRNCGFHLVTLPYNLFQPALNAVGQRAPSLAPEGYAAARFIPECGSGSNRALSADRPSPRVIRTSSASAAFHRCAP